MNGDGQPSTVVLVGFAVALAAATIAVYAPVRDFGFVNFDDPGYVSANPEVARGLGLDTVAWAFTTTRTANWIPITWLSYLLDVSLFGASPGAHHVVNVLLHVANAVLLLLLALRLRCRPPLAALLAALFALHPLRVESVAWISERKDVLCALLGLSSLYLWVGWTRYGGRGRYGAALLLFGLGLMAKPMLVTLPFVLLLLDFWPLRRTRWSGAWEDRRGHVVSWARLMLEKIPFFALAVASSAVTFFVQRAGGAVADTVVLPLPARLRGAIAAYGWYAGKTLWPEGLAALYPNPALLGGSPPDLAILGGGVLLVGSAAAALGQARRRPWLVVGMGIFVGMLVPVVGLVQVGQQSTADRYTYLPGIGLALVVTGLLDEAARRLRVAPPVRIAVVLGLLAALAVATRVQVGYWRDSLTLARRTLAVTDHNYVMQFNLAVALDERGDLPGALAAYAEAVRLRPDLAAFRVNHAAALARAGRVEEAVAEYAVALQLAPHDRAARNNLAWLRATHPDARHRDGRTALALASALAQQGPADTNTLDLLAAALAEVGRFAEAERTAAAALAAAHSSGATRLAAALASRREIYAAGRAYREDPASVAVLAPPS
ncbi:MAG: hypothetical protein FJ148_04280 [Deltaproteobacteria bacterium]|nr:hypothetical protein [Deltaproteobacteria bacterium]